MNDATFAYLQLSLTPGIGTVIANRLVIEAGSAIKSLTVDPGALARVQGIGKSKSAELHRGIRAARDETKRVVDRCDQLGISIYSLIDYDYPVMLAMLPDAPTVIFVKGQLEPRDLHAVGLVGSRKCSLYGREQAERFANQLAQMGVTVVSGGARGVDTQAHRGALLTSNGRTVAVLGCGTDVAYPPENRELFAQISEEGRGALISEHPPGTPPAAENFPRRNRVISGLSRGIVVIEADERSGALITARQCIEDHNRQVFAVPGRVDSPTSSGPHRLIREGAILVTCAADVVEGLGAMPDIESYEAGRGFQRATEGLGLEDPVHTRLGVLEPAIEFAPVEFPPGETLQGMKPRKFSAKQDSPKQSTPIAVPTLEGDRKLVFESLGIDSRSADDVANATRLEIQVVMRELTMLSMLGLIRRVDGNSYQRKS